jgi:hypothetical protein
MQGKDILFCVMGIAAIAWSVYAFRNPSVILRSRKSKVWVRMIGEEKTIWVGKYIGAPLAVAMGLGLFFIGLRPLL